MLIEKCSEIEYRLLSNEKCLKETEPEFRCIFSREINQLLYEVYWVYIVINLA